MSTTAPVHPEHNQRELPVRPEHSRRASVEGHSLCQHFPLIATAPNGIKKLRELILELAVRGKLVPQDPNDEPASELLERIEAEKMRLAAEKKIKRHKPLPLITNREKRFTPPNGWHWIRFGDFANQIATGPFGSMLHKSDYVKGGVPVINPTHMIGGEIVPDRRTTVPAVKAEELDGYRLGEGNIVIARRGEVGRAALVREEAAGWLCGTGSFVLRLHQDVGRSFVIMILRTLWVRAYLAGESVGTTMANLNHGILKRMPILVPPHAEQHRIVTKVDELMALCDRLEAQQADTEAAHTTLVKTLLDTLTQSRSAEDFAANWQRLGAHFDTLFTTESSIDALKQTLLQLAVMGKLVPQDPSDEPASELLERIQAERLRMEEADVLKKTTPLQINEDDKPYDTPVGWTWVRLGGLLGKIGAGSTPLGGKRAYVSEGVKFLRSQNVWDEGLRLSGVALIPPVIHQKMSGTHVQAGDLLFNITGASIGRCALVPDDFDVANVSQHVSIIRPIDADTRFFLHKLLISRYVQKTVMDVQVGVSREGLSIRKLSQFVIPLPPLAEQHRIVVKVDELMALCDRLKARLADSRTVHERLTDALAQVRAA